MNIPLNIDWQQILLHLLNFVILAGGLYLLLYQPVKKFMAQREEHYRQMAAQAEQTRQEAQQIKEDYQARLQAVEEEIGQRRAQAQREIDQSTQIQMIRAQEQADKILSDAQAAAQRTRTKVLEESQEELKELAMTAAEKLLLQSKGDPYDQFLDLAERGERHE